MRRELTKLVRNGNFPMKQILTLAHSPDPDDAFMWWPLADIDGSGSSNRYRRIFLSKLLWKILKR